MRDKWFQERVATIGNIIQKRVLSTYILKLWMSCHITQNTQLIFQLCFAPKRLVELLHVTAKFQYEINWTDIYIY